MAREFLLRYFKRVAVLLPIAAVLILVPPGPLGAKFFGLIGVLVALLIAQLAELALVHHRRAAARRPPTSAPSEPRSRRT